MASSAQGTPQPRASRRQVEPIVEDVRARGDEAVREYTSRFDKVDLDDVCVPLAVRTGGACSLPTAPLQPSSARTETPQGTPLL